MPADASDEAYRLRLEGRAELLEAARLRYRALTAVVSGLTWRRKVRAHLALLREVARWQGEVDDALAVVQRRAAAEGWRSTSPTVKCASDVAAARARLEQRVRRHLRSEASGQSLEQCLGALERVAALGPRQVLPGQRAAAAHHALPDGLPELATLRRFGAALKSLFTRPRSATGELPFTADELRTVEQQWPAGETALASAWSRLQQVDPSGGVERAYRRRARRAPTSAPRDGPQTLLAAEFYRELALARLRTATVKVSPVTCADGELFAVVGWLYERERRPLARLKPTGSLSEPRAGLLELASALQGMPAQRPVPEAVWERLLECATLAEQLPEDDGDLVRLRDNLRLSVAVLTRENRRPLQPARRRASTQTRTLSALVLAMRQRLS